jgi:acyl-coenzyme A thioesterase PaaI-like protein
MTAEARSSLAQAIRRLVADTTTTAASDDQFAVARELVESASAALRPVPGVAGHRARTEAGVQPTLNPFDSAGNPLAPPLVPRVAAPGEYIAEFTLSPAYEGPPGRAHGGVVTGILDHACGYALRSMDTLAVSVSLTIDLHHPTPYGEPLIVAARVDERDGRKIWVDADITTAGGTVTASCRTLMLQLREKPAWAETAMRP